MKSAEKKWRYSWKLRRKSKDSEKEESRLVIETKNWKKGDKSQAKQAGQDMKDIQAGCKITLDFNLEGGEQTASKCSPYINSHNMLQAVQVKTVPAANRNNNCLTTSTGYPLVTNQSLHARCAYHISIIRKQLFFQEQYRLAQLRQLHTTYSHQQAQAVGEAIRIKESQN